MVSQAVQKDKVARKVNCNSLKLVTFHANNKCHLFSFLSNDTLHWYKECGISELHKYIFGMKAFFNVPNKTAIVYSELDIQIDTEEVVRLYDICVQEYPVIENYNLQNKSNQRKLF